MESLSTEQKAEYNLHRVCCFICINFLITIFISRSYISVSGISESFLDRLFVYLACLSNTCMMYLGLGLLLLILARIILHTAWVGIFSVLIMLTFQIVLFIDTIIYRLFYFHINGMVVNLLFTEGAGDSLHLGTSTYITFISITFLILMAQIVIWCGTGFWMNRLSHPRFAFKKVLIFVLTISILTILTDKIVYMVGDLYNDIRITRCIKIFPFYQPLTIRRFAQKYLGFRVNRENLIMTTCSSRTLNYPRQKLEFKKAGNLPNILWIVIDSLRFDMLNSQVSPNLYELSHRWLDFRMHYSGGNSTRYGVYSLFYGMYPLYWQNFLSEHRGPVLVDALLNLDYRIHILSSTRLTYPEFRKTAFVKIPECIDDLIPGKGASERDPLQVQHFLNWLDTTDDARPFFGFLFLDGPHGPYSYPKEFDMFKPSMEQVNYLNVGKEETKLPLYNRYRNAVFFDDHVTGDLIKAIEDRGLMNSTIIMITGDHGEEFNESGYWGHASAFSEQEIHVPLLMHVPGHSPSKIHRLTSHMDLPATMLEFMGCTTDHAQYSQGHSLLDSVGSPFVVCSGWDDFAFIDPEYKIVMSSNVGLAEVRDKNYHRVDSDPLISKRKNNYLLGFLAQHRRFMGENGQ
jgi:uncharacterized protein